MKELERIILFGLSQNINKEKIDSLISEGKSLKDILVYDYLLKSNPYTSESNMFKEILDKEHPPSYWYEKKYFKFKTSQKKLILDECKKDLPFLLKPKLDELSTKNELKQVYCLDKILSEMDSNRVKRIDFSQDIPSLLNFAIDSFKNQLIVLDMKNVRREFQEKSREVDYDDISSGDLIYLDSISEKILKNSTKTSLDSEVCDEIESSKEALKKLEQDIKGSIEKKIKKYTYALKKFKLIDEKKSLSKEDILTLKRSRHYLLDIEKTLAYNGDSRGESVSELLEKHNLLLLWNENFNHDKRRFYRTLKNQKKITKKMKKLKLIGKSFSYEFRKVNKIKKYLEKTNYNLDRLDKFYENKYVRYIFRDEKSELLNQLKSINPSENWYKKLSYHNPDDHKNKFSFMGEQRMGDLIIERTKKREEVLENILSFNKRINKEEFI